MSSVPPDGPRDPEGELNRLHDAIAEQDYPPAKARAIARALLVLADAVERPPGRPTDGPRHYRGRAIMPRHLHDVWCGWRVATRDDERPDLAWCAGCGLAVTIPVAGEQR